MMAEDGRGHIVGMITHREWEMSRVVHFFRATGPVYLGRWLC
jgi:hypothetical protein